MDFNNFKLGVAFDASHVRGKCENYERDLDFHNLEATEHDKHLEFDYKYFQDRGVEFFRDGSLLYKTCPSPNEYNWNYLDRVAEQDGEIQISLSHYEFPLWLERTDILEGKFADFLSDFSYHFAERYGNRFHSVIPCVEIGYWCHMISSWQRWYPFVDGWWKIYDKVIFAAIESAKVLRQYDIDVALSEPFGLETPIRDQARPFLTMLGEKDLEADKAGYPTYLHGNNNLLQILGMNYYRLDTVKDTTEQLKELITGKELIIAETGNIHHCDISAKEWIQTIDGLGKLVDLVIWSPAVEMSNFEQGETMGGFLLERARNCSDNEV